MSADEIKDQIKQIIANVSSIPVAEIGDDDHYVEDLDLDSLSLLEIGVDVDYAFKLGLGEEEMRSVVTVSQGVALVLERLTARSEEAPNGVARSINGMAVVASVA